MKITFTKMHGLGNDFIVVDAREEMKEVNWSDMVGTLLDRRFGVGGDSLLVLERSEVATCKMRIFERDGIESENCGNGLRCVGKYLSDRGATTQMTIETLAGVTSVLQASRDQYRVQMGEPRFESHEIGVSKEPAPWGAEIEVLDKVFRVYTVSMGNPHCVIYVNQREDLSFVTQYGSAIENHPWFVNRTNVNFVYRANPFNMIVRTWERSAGHTLACGTGACAVGVVSIRLGLSQSPCHVQFEFGELEIEWQEGRSVLMSGPAKYVFQGAYEC